MRDGACMTGGMHDRRGGMHGFIQRGACMTGGHA